MGVDNHQEVAEVWGARGGRRERGRGKEGWGLLGEARRGQGGRGRKRRGEGEGGGRDKFTGQAGVSRWHEQTHK